MEDIVQKLKEEFEETDAVWFLVDTRFRILQFNKKAADNSVAFHNKKLVPGASILDYVRDTKNKIDTDFIECFGRAANGEEVEKDQEIVYNSIAIRTRTKYTPVYENNTRYGVSILVTNLT